MEYLQAKGVGSAVHYPRPSISSPYTGIWGTAMSPVPWPRMSPAGS